ncbi:MAG: DUF1573 domain-containing protein, partial [Chitinophagaceae bacterium]|nr:DUF1573 domain-containing protein [Chitinophagaceae bacterium]
MKKILFTLFAVCAGFFVMAQQTVTPPSETIQMSETTYNFGKIAQGKPVTHNFVITNT